MSQRQHQKMVRRRPPQIRPQLRPPHLALVLSVILTLNAVKGKSLSRAGFPTRPRAFMSLRGPLLPYVIARPSEGGRGNLTVPIRIYEHERLLRRYAPRNDIFSVTLLSYATARSSVTSRHCEPASGGRGNLTVPLRTNESEEIASSLRSSQRHTRRTTSPCHCESASGGRGNLTVPV